MILGGTAAESSSHAFTISFQSGQMVDDRRPEKAKAKL